VSSERNGHAPLPLGLLASLRAAIVAVVLVASLASGLTLAGKDLEQRITQKQLQDAHAAQDHEEAQGQAQPQGKTRFQASAPLPIDREEHRLLPRLHHRPHRAAVCGGADAPSNMQWQTIAASKAKDKFERQECSAFPRR